MSATVQQPLGSSPVAASTADTIDTSNVQGDIISQIPKKAQAFFFYQIKDVQGFKAALARFIPFIATETAVAKGRNDIAQHKKSNASGLLDLRFTTVSFSSKGLVQLGIKDDINDASFTAGQLADAQSLGDKGTTQSNVFEPDWLFAFKHDIHGLITVSGPSVQIVQIELLAVLAHFNCTIREVYKVIGSVRPGAEDGHEHFGFNDGISNPAIDGLSVGNPGDDSVSPGVILLGREGDNQPGTATPVERPSWAVDGSFLAFRLLNQLVPEFNNFLAANALKTSDDSVSGSDLLGARLFGRWKSGAPIMLTPTKDDPVLATDTQHRNDFEYDLTSQEKCPFAAHIRKTYPRNDLGDTADDPHRIVRRGIAFGPEVTALEKASEKTVFDRGLLFVSYQASLFNGFQFLQKKWANNNAFPPNKPQTPGVDAIIGQVVSNPDNVGVRSLSGTNPGDATASLSLGTQDFVVPKGGEYFFSPSISALKNTIAA